MKNNAKIIAVINQKGGTGKTTTTENLGVGLANEGKKVLLIDLDSQGSLTIALGNFKPNELYPTTADIMKKIIQESAIESKEGIIHHQEGVDLLPANKELSGMEISLVSIKNRERVLKRYVDQVKKEYDFILIDCLASLGMLTINALTAADSVIIPIEAHALSVKGLEQELFTISQVKQKMNHKLKIEGVLFSRVDRRTSLAKRMTNLIKDTYGANIRVFETDIPNSIRVAETPEKGISIYKHAPKVSATEAFKALTKEVLEIDKKERKHRTEQLR